MRRLLNVVRGEDIEDFDLPDGVVHVEDHREGADELHGIGPGVQDFVLVIAALEGIGFERVKERQYLALRVLVQPLERGKDRIPREEPIVPQALPSRFFISSSDTQASGLASSRSRFSSFW